MPENLTSDIIERLRESSYESGAEYVWPLLSEAADEIERLREALQQILQWSEAYPTDIFHEPTKEECQRAHELLTANGMTLDAFSAVSARHCTTGIGKIARSTLEKK